MIFWLCYFKYFVHFSLGALTSRKTASYEAEFNRYQNNCTKAFLSEIYYQQSWHNYQERRLVKKKTYQKILFSGNQKL